ncbi:uncharacterized protein LOC110453396 [Mizuhopecten yessoensis]|uniref:uncharacterized protein LOC110453396 n=1 Tax=Mizuhopecten yessoensis TaxID=6573 RepID=UPI000B45E529|nr:uncharacterized protein LOC110453396 [Mizuhopecten yessoensis]
MIYPPEAIDCKDLKGHIGLLNCMDNGAVQPVHQHMTSCTDRLVTFFQWGYQLRQSSYQLACDGFFHEGVGDNVTCCKCGKTLKYWEHKNFPVECIDHQYALPYPPKPIKIIDGMVVIRDFIREIVNWNIPRCDRNAFISRLCDAERRMNELKTDKWKDRVSKMVMS